MPRLTLVKKARKSARPRTCRVCSKEIELGQSFYHWAFMVGGRGGPKQFVHADCKSKLPRSASTSSEKLGRIYDAQDACVAGIDSVVEISSIIDFMQELAASVREVSDEYRESAENIRASFSESSTADDCEEKAESLDSWVDGLESFEPDDEESLELEEGLTDEETEEKMAEYVEEKKEEALQIAESCPV